jgi:hypothetical protein
MAACAWPQYSAGPETLFIVYSASQIGRDSLDRAAVPPSPRGHGKPPAPIVHLVKPSS